MKQSKKLITALISLQLAAIAPTAVAVEPVNFFEMDFETPDKGSAPVKNTPYPDWQLTPTFDDHFGPGNHFTISNTSSHSGLRSLKFTYEARNDFCNTCGTYGAKHKTGLNNVDYFVADSGENLALKEDVKTTKINDGPAAQPKRHVYNKTNGFSQWEIVSVQNHTGNSDKLALKLLRPGINGETPVFNGGDDIAIAKQCGVDGTIGVVQGKNDINRRSDCDSVITWFGNVKPQVPGTSIFRRNYLKAEITSPVIRQKLHYLRPGQPNYGEIVLFGDSSNSTAPDVHGELTGFLKYGKLNSYKPALNNGFGSIIFQRGVWYYVEEEYKAATSNLAVPGTYNPDGAYRLWFGKSGQEPKFENPTFELTGIPLPPITGGDGQHISFWGNMQHWTHSRGSWYMDDIKISDSFNGPVAGGVNNTATPKPPQPGGN